MKSKKDAGTQTKEQEIVTATLVSCTALIQNVGSVVYGGPAGAFVLMHGADGHPHFAGNIEPEALIVLLETCITGLREKGSEMTAYRGGMN